MNSASSVAFLSLDTAMAQPHGTEVDVIAVVVYVGPADYSLLYPYGTVELCLMDARLSY